MAEVMGPTVTTQNTQSSSAHRLSNHLETSRATAHSQVGTSIIVRYIMLFFRDRLGVLQALASILFIAVACDQSIPLVTMPICDPLLGPAANRTYRGIPLLCNFVPHTVAHL